MGICGGEIRLRACGFIDFRRLGILPWVVVLTSYAARHIIGYFVHGFVDVFSHRV